MDPYDDTYHVGDVFAALRAADLHDATAQAVRRARSGDPGGAEGQWLAAVALWWRHAAAQIHTPALGTELASAVVLMRAVLPTDPWWDRAAAAADELGQAADADRVVLAGALMSCLGIDPDARVADDLLRDCAALARTVAGLGDAEAAELATALVTDVMVVIADPDTPAETRTLLVTDGLAGVAAMAAQRPGDVLWAGLGLVAIALDGDDDLARLARLAHAVIELQAITQRAAS